MAEPAPPDDLRTRALNAIRHGDHALANDGECGRPDDQAAVVDAVLAVVLPAHRRRIAADIRAEADRWERLGYDDDGAWVAAVHIAATGPAARQESPQTAQQGPAVPQEASEAQGPPGGARANLDEEIEFWAAHTPAPTDEYADEYASAVPEQIPERDRLAGELRQAQADLADLRWRLKATSDALNEARNELGEDRARLLRKLREADEACAEATRQRDAAVRAYEACEHIPTAEYAEVLADYPAEYIRNDAADVAQRIVDEIGHPVTDEDALGPSYREQIAALQAERDQLAGMVRVLWGVYETWWYKASTNDPGRHLVSDGVEITGVILLHIGDDQAMEDACVLVEPHEAAIRQALGTTAPDQDTQRRRRLVAVEADRDRLAARLGVDLLPEQWEAHAAKLGAEYERAAPAVGMFVGWLAYRHENERHHAQIARTTRDLVTGRLATTEAERDELADTLRRYEPVIDAAKAWRAAGWNTLAGAAATALTKAIEALGDADLLLPLGEHGSKLGPTGQTVAYRHSVGRRVTVEIYDGQHAGTVAERAPSVLDGAPVYCVHFDEPVPTSTGPIAYRWCREDVILGDADAGQSDEDITEAEFDRRWASGTPVEAVGAAQTHATSPPIHLVPADAAMGGEWRTDGKVVVRWRDATACCDMHGRNCEPPSELCCQRCTEAAHDTFPVRHADGSACSAPDLGGTDQIPAPKE